MSPISPTPRRIAPLSSRFPGMRMSLFIEAAFAQRDEELASGRGHLTTAAAGQIARRAGARRVEPFHFSSLSRRRTPGRKVRAAFSGSVDRPHSRIAAVRDQHAAGEW